MGRIVDFPQSANQLHELGFKAFREGKYQVAIDNLDQLCHEFPDDVTPGDVRTLAGAYLKVGQLDAAYDVVQDATDDLIGDANGRYLLMQVATAIPDFPLGTFVVNGTSDSDEQSDSIDELAHAMDAYAKQHADKVQQAKRHLRHLGGMSILGQEQFITTELGKIPFDDVTESLQKALVDPDVHPAVRSSLLTWAMIAAPTASLKVWVYDRFVTVLPKNLKMPGEDDTTQEVLGSIVDQLPAQEELLQTLVPTVFVLMGFLYPVAGTIVDDVDEFAATAIDPNRDSRYRPVLDWLTKAAQELSDAGSSIDN